MKSTGLEKGGIYNHFGSKDQLALEAFDYAVGVFGARFLDSLKDKDGAVDKLHAFLDQCLVNASDPPIPGGCPLLNTAVESDDGHPELRDRVQKAMGRLLSLVERLVAQGVSAGELRAEIDPKKEASIIVSSIEGGLMIARLYGEPERLAPVVAHLKAHVSSLSG